MKKKYAITVALLILAGGILIFLWKAGHGQKGEEPSDRKAAPAAEHSGHEAVPRADVQGAQKEAPAEEPPTVEIPVDRQQMIGVKTVEVTVRPLQKSIRTVGRIEYDERKLATVNAKFEDGSRSSLLIIPDGR